MYIASADTGGNLDDLDSQLKLLSFLDNPAVVVAAAAAGDVAIIRDFLTKNPQHVRCSSTLPSMLEVCRLSDSSMGI